MIIFNNFITNKPHFIYLFIYLNKSHLSKYCEKSSVEILPPFGNLQNSTSRFIEADPDPDPADQN